MFNNTLYSKGYRSLENKINAFIEANPEYGHDSDYIGDEYSTTIRSDEDIAEELERECAEDAYINDGYTRLGQLTVEEIFFLFTEHYDNETAYEYLEEVEYFETEAVA